MSLREPLKPARSEPASNVHAPLAVSDACLATFSLPFTSQLRHSVPPALPRSAASASCGQPGGCQAATPRAMGAARLIRRWSRPAARSCRRSTAGAGSLDASRRASWRGSGRSATASWRLGASLRDVPPRSCCAAVAQGPGGEQRQRQQRPGDDRGGGGCPRRSTGSRCGCLATWGTRLGYSRGCSLVAGCCTGVPQQRWPPKSTGAGV